MSTASVASIASVASTDSTHVQPSLEPSASEAVYTTPEENQELYRLALLELVSRTPKRDVFVSRISSFKRKRQTEIANKRIRFDLQSDAEQTPRREIVMRMPRSLDKRDVPRAVPDSERLPFLLDADSPNTSIRRLFPARRTPAREDGNAVAYYQAVVDELKRQPKEPGKPSSRLLRTRSDNLNSPSLYRTVLIGEAMKQTPAKRRRIIVSKRRKRNSIVRRTVHNYRTRHPRRGRKARKRFDYLGSPLSECASLPDDQRLDAKSPFSCDPPGKMSRSVDDFGNGTGEKLSTPVRSLVRARHLDDIACWKDENENDMAKGLWCPRRSSGNALDRTVEPLSPETRTDVDVVATTSPGIVRSRLIGKDAHRSVLCRTDEIEYDEAASLSCDDASPSDARGRAVATKLETVRNWPTFPKRKKRQRKIWKFW
ncbi:uncharacterized protein LOC143361967 [Halictus rubicundus]|uniref:uncharacterized protein LOC143361967 n=1 Tax=Halictus rubicundus TaxID=77578 RepID=UPI0040370DBC